MVGKSEKSKCFDYKPEIRDVKWQSDYLKLRLGI